MHRQVKIILILSLFTIALVFAIEPGTYTQQQIDNVNVSSLGLECNYTGWDIVYYRDYPIKLKYNFNCLNIKRAMNGNIETQDTYDVYRDYFSLNYRIADVYDCLWTYRSFPVCKRLVIEPSIRGQFFSYRSGVLNTVRFYQTPPNISNYDFDFNISGVI